MNVLTKMVAGTVFMIVFTAGAAAIGGWWLMLTTGVIHAEWVQSLPPVGYGTAAKVAAMFSIGPGLNTLRRHYWKS